MKVKEESEKVGLKLNIQKTKMMASGPITSWQIDGEAVADFILAYKWKAFSTDWEEAQFCVFAVPAPFRTPAGSCDMKVKALHLEL